MDENHCDQIVAKFPAHRLPVSAEFRQRFPVPRGDNFSSRNRALEVIEPLNVPSPGFTGDAHCYSANELNASSVIEELSEATRTLNNRISNGAGRR